MFRVVAGVSARIGSVRIESVLFDLGEEFIDASTWAGRVVAWPGAVGQLQPSEAPQLRHL